MCSCACLFVGLPVCSYVCLLRVWSLLFVVCCLLFADCRLSMAMRCVMCVASCVLLIVSLSLVGCCSLLFAIRRVVSVGCCS